MRNTETLTGLHKIKSALFTQWQRMLTNNIATITKNAGFEMVAPVVSADGVRLFIDSKQGESTGVVVIEERPQPRIVKIKDDIYELMMPYVVHCLTFSKRNDFNYYGGYFVFFQNKPLTSIDDILGQANLPNTGCDGSSCLGKDAEVFVKDGFKNPVVMAKALTAYFWGGTFNDMEMGSIEQYQIKSKEQNGVRPYLFDNWEKIPFDGSILQYDWLPRGYYYTPQTRPANKWDLKNSTLKTFLTQTVRIGTDAAIRKATDVLQSEVFKFVVSSENNHDVTENQCNMVVKDIKVAFMEEMKIALGNKVKEFEKLDPAAADLLEGVFQEIIEENLLYKSEKKN